MRTVMTKTNVYAAIMHGTPSKHAVNKAFGCVSVL